MTDVVCRAALTLLLAALWSGCGGEPDSRRTASGGGGGGASPVASAAATVGPSDPNGLPRDRFHAGRAFALLEKQVGFGERPAGSEASRALALELKSLLPSGRFENLSGGLRNVVGHLPGTRPAIVVAAHYDTKVIDGFVGAEDGAGGTAAVVELARGLRRLKRSRDAPEIRFVLFDGEECDGDDADFYSCGLRGSRAYAKRHGKRNLGKVIVLDFIAQKDLAIRYEPGSDRSLWRQLRSAAKAVGALEVFPPDAQGTVLDDHTPFARAGIPAIDLIDFEFPCWHQTCDDLSVVSAASLDKSGESVFELVRRLGRRR